MPGRHCGDAMRAKHAAEMLAVATARPTRKPARLAWLIALLLAVGVAGIVGIGLLR